MIAPHEQRQRVISISVDVYVTLLAITLLTYLALRLLMPFFSVLIWASALAVALYPVFNWLRGVLGGRSALSATLIAVIGLVVLLAPTALVVESMIDSFRDISGKVSGGDFADLRPRESVKDWPLVGNMVFDLWTNAHDNLRATLEHFAPQLQTIATKLLGVSAGLVAGILQFALSIVFAAVFLSASEPLSGSVMRVARRLDRERGQKMIEMAGATIRNVSRGVVGVAVIQGALATVGIFAYGLPFAGIIAALTLILCIVQAPPLGILPIIAYAWSTDGGTAALIFTVYMLAVMFLDNVLKPMLMGRGLTTPTVVILLGVIGGTLTSGMLGLFIGPVVLALFYELVMTWIASTTQPAESVTAARDHA